MFVFRRKPVGRVAAVLALLLLTASCGGETNHDAAPNELGMSAGDATATNGSAALGLERTSVDGITLTAEQLMFDYGEGPELTLSIRGDHPDGVAGVQMSHDLEASTDTIDSIGWAASANTYVALVEVGPTVTEVQLVSTEGRTDSTVPTERLALVGIRTADASAVTINAMDASGAIVGTCAQDDFFTCTTAG